MPVEHGFSMPMTPGITSIKGIGSVPPDQTKELGVLLHTGRVMLKSIHT